MRLRVLPRRPAPRTVVGVGAAVVIAACAFLYPGRGGSSVAVAGPATRAPATSGAPGWSRAVADRADGAPSAAGARRGQAPTSSTTPPAVTLPDGPECPASLPAGWLAAENRRHGNPLATPSGRVGPASVVGYADRSSAACGEMLTVQLGGPATAVDLVAYRVGWYGGAGARAVWRSGSIPVTPRPMPSGAAYPHLVEPQWPMTTTIVVDGHWTPGFYLIVPVGPAGTARANRAMGPAIPLTVRDDGGTAPVLFKASTLTWAAYDDWGGWSLYRGPVGSGPAASAQRARVVSLHRPLVGGGYDQMEYMDLPVVRQLERTGLDVAYTTDEDVDADPSSLQGHAEVVIGGHGEYWTRPMYDGLLQARDAGVNLTFLGANNLWWQARLERSAVAARPDRLAVYRVAAEDPAARSDPAAATILWGQQHRDPAALLGQSYAAIGVHGGLQVLDAPSWFLAGSGLTSGSVLPGSVGNEASGYNPRGGNPVTTQVLAAGVLRSDRGPVVVSVEYVTFPSGSAVFAAGSTDWACVPSGRCSDMTPPAATAAAVGVLTRNVVIALSQPRAGATWPATPVIPFVAAQLLPQLAPAAIGSVGTHSAEKD